MSAINLGIRLRKERWALGCLAALGLAAAPAHGAWLVEPSLELSTGYDDNVRLNDDPEEDAIVSTGTVQARLRNVTERSEVSGLLGLTYLTYSATDDEDLDDEDAEFVDLSARRDYQRGELGARLTGRRDLILRVIDPIPGLLPGAGDDADPGTPLDEALAEDDIDLNATREQVRRTWYRLSPYASYQLGQLTSARIEYSFAERLFDEDGEDQGLRDSRTHLVSAGLRRELSPRTAGSITLGAGRFESDGREETDNYTASLGFDHQISPQVTFGADVGAGRVDDDIGEETHLTYGVRLARQMLVSRLSIQAERSAAPSSFGNVVEADRLTVRYQRSLSDRAEFDMRIHGYRTEQVGDGADESSRKYLSVRPRLTLRMTNAWNTGIEYLYRWTDRDRADAFGGSGTAQGNMVVVFIGYQPPRRL